MGTDMAVVSFTAKERETKESCDHVACDLHLLDVAMSYVTIPWVYPVQFSPPIVLSLTLFLSPAPLLLKCPLLLCG